MIPKCITLKEVSKQTGYNKYTIIKWIDKGLIKPIRTPGVNPKGSGIRFVESDVLKLLGIEDASTPTKEVPMK